MRMIKISHGAVMRTQFINLRLRRNLRYVRWGAEAQGPSSEAPPVAFGTLSAMGFQTWNDGSAAEGAKARGSRWGDPAGLQAWGPLASPQIFLRFSQRKALICPLNASCFEGRQG